MKYCAIIFSLLSHFSFAQFETLETKTHVIVENDSSTVKTEILYQSLNAESDDKFYYSYNKGTLFKTFGEINGFALNGNFQQYDNSGHLLEKGLFKLGLKDGEWKKWNADGILISSVHYRSGLLHGAAHFYNQEGIIAEIRHYKKGKQIGKSERYFDNMKLNEIYRNGELVKSDTIPIP